MLWIAQVVEELDPTWDELVWYHQLLDLAESRAKSLGHKVPFDTPAVCEAIEAVPPPHDGTNER